MIGGNEEPGATLKGEGRRQGRGEGKRLLRRRTWLCQEQKADGINFRFGLASACSGPFSKTLKRTQGNDSAHTATRRELSQITIMVPSRSPVEHAFVASLLVHVSSVAS